MRPRGFADWEPKLGADDIVSLKRLDRHNKQVWAELLAHRLVRERLRHRVV